ncbi:MAG: hypothetical protein MI922_08825 [Bacteroidales bacterium]|nr:hypothetical protein [Bacteroidales bacterium]
MKLTSVHLMVLVLGLLTIVSCDELLDELGISYNTDPHSFTFTVYPMEKGEQVLDVDTITIDFEKELEENGISSIGLVEEIVIQEVIFTLVDGLDNFNNFESFEVFINAPGLSEKKMAWLDKIPEGATTLSPNILDVNLVDYITKEKYMVKLKAVLTENIEKTVLISAEIKYKVST